MEQNSSQPSKITYTGGVRETSGDRKIKRFDNPKDAYNDLYSDLHKKLNGGSSWVKPNTTLDIYISKFAPAEDSNDPKSYSAHMVDYFNSKLKDKNITINKGSTLSEIKNALIKAGYDPEHEFTKAHLQIEDPKVLKALNLS